EGERLSPEALAAAARRHRPTHLDLVPVQAEALLLDNPAMPPIDCLLLGGERLPATLLQALDSRGPAVGRILNLYGPTEACIDATAHEIGDRQDASVPIGRPLGGYRAYVLDRALS